PARGAGRGPRPPVGRRAGPAAAPAPVLRLEQTSSPPARPRRELPDFWLSGKPLEDAGPGPGLDPHRLGFLPTDRLSRSPPNRSSPAPRYTHTPGRGSRGPSCSPP